MNLQKRLRIAEEKVEAEREARTEDTCCAFLIEFALILWDGAGFFGLKTAKLDRIRGKPVGFCTKCLDV